MCDRVRRLYLLTYLLTYYRHLHEPALGKDDRAQAAAVAAARVQAWLATVRAGCAVRTARPRRVRVHRTYSTWGPGGKWPCVSDTRETHVQYGGRPRRARVS